MGKYKYNLEMWFGRLGGVKMKQLLVLPFVAVLVMVNFRTF